MNWSENHFEFLIRDELMAATVFEEKLEIDKSEFYLSETIMNTETESFPFQPIEHFYTKMVKRG